MSKRRRESSAEEEAKKEDEAQYGSSPLTLAELEEK